MKTGKAWIFLKNIICSNQHNNELSGSTMAAFYAQKLPLQGSPATHKPASVCTCAEVQSKAVFSSFMRILQREKGAARFRLEQFLCRNVFFFPCLTRTINLYRFYTGKSFFHIAVVRVDHNTMQSQQLIVIILSVFQHFLRFFCFCNIPSWI